jgi:hypothetical protein
MADREQKVSALIARELARTRTSVRKDDEVTLQAKASAETVRQALGQTGE